MPCCHLFQQWQPVALAQLAMLATASVFLSSGYMLLIRAMRAGDVSLIVPFRYSGLLAALTISTVVWGGSPNTPSRGQTYAASPPACTWSSPRHGRVTVCLSQRRVAPTDYRRRLKVRSPAPCRVRTNVPQGKRQSPLPN